MAERKRKERLSVSQKRYRLQRILEMIEDDRKPSYIARIFGISRQAVDQIIKAHEAEQSASIASITDDKGDYSE
jgi:hypothetical protein